MRNIDVVRSWARGDKAATANLHTDGRILWSYNLVIGETTDAGKVSYCYTSGGSFGFVSQTTSKHVGLARRFAHKNL